MPHSVALTDCPVCAGTLTQIRLGEELVLRSCSTCDIRWWQRGEQMAKRDEAMALVAALPRNRKSA